MTFHDPGSGVALVPCDCGDDCEFVKTDCCSDAQRECETERQDVWMYDHLEDRFQFCAPGFGCNVERQSGERTGEQ